MRFAAPRKLRTIPEVAAPELCQLDVFARLDFAFTIPVAVQRVQNPKNGSAIGGFVSFTKLKCGRNSESVFRHSCIGGAIRGACHRARIRATCWLLRPQARALPRKFSLSLSLSLS